MWIFTVNVPFTPTQTVHVVAPEADYVRAWEVCAVYMGGAGVRMVSARWFDITPEDVFNA